MRERSIRLYLAWPRGETCIELVESRDAAYCGSGLLIGFAGGGRGKGNGRKRKSRAVPGSHGDAESPCEVLYRKRSQRGGNTVFAGGLIDYASQRPEAPQGRTRPLEVTGRPISSARTLP